MAAQVVGNLYGKNDVKIRDLIKEKDKIVEMGLDTTFVNSIRLLDAEISRLKEPECQVIGAQYDPDRTMVKIYVPVDDYPHDNLIGRLIGKKGCTIQEIQNDTCTRITIIERGRECVRRRTGSIATLTNMAASNHVSHDISYEDRNASYVTIEPAFISKNNKDIQRCLIKATERVKRAMLPSVPPDAPCWTKNNEHVTGAPSSSAKQDRTRTPSSRHRRHNNSGTRLHYEQDDKILLHRLYKMWKNSEMCDVVLDIGTEQIPAHRVVLASLSPFFQTLFSTSVGVSSKRRQKTIKLQECEPLAAKVLVEFAYTRKLQVDSCNVQGLLSGASFLQLHKVKEACAAHLANELCPYNCIGISVFADFHDLGNLKRTADKMAIRHFPHVVEGGELIDAPFHSHLLPLLRRKSVTNAFPVQLFEAVLSWLERDMISREKHLREILKYLPIARIPPNYMKEVLLPNHRDVIQRRIVQNKIAKAKQTTNSPDEVGDNKPSTSKDFVQKTRTENDGDLEICKALDRVSDKDPCDSERSKLSSEEDSEFQKVVSSPFGLIIPLVDGFDSSSSTSVCSFQFTECGKLYKRGTRSLDDKLFLNSIVQTANSLLSVGGIEQERYSFATYKAEKCVSKEYCFLVGPTCRDQGKRFVAIDIYSGKEDDLPRLKFARLDLGSALYNGRIYAVGGGMIHPDNSAESGSATDVDPSSVECFDLEGGASTWNIVHSMAHPRDSTRAAVIANRLFAVGGGISVVNKCTTPEQSKSETESDICFSFPSLKKFKRETESYNVSYTSLNVVEAYDHRTGQWTEMAPLQTARRGHGLVAYDERLYCAGGYDGNKCLDSVECYEPRMNRWYSVASLQTPRHGVALGVVNGTLYAVGGNSDYDKLISGDVDLTTCPLFEMYDPWLDSWKTVERFSDTSYASIFREQSCYCTSATSSFCDLRKKVTKTTSIGPRSVIVPRYSPRSWSSFRSVINPRKEIDF